MNSSLVKRPLVSVCIPTYNRAHMLKECIQSVLTQSMSNFELIISDNASQDSTESVVKSLPDVRIKYYKNNINIGARENWQQCLVLSQGDYITIIPDDDMMLPDSLESRAEILYSHPNVGFVHAKFHAIDANGQIIKYDTNWMHGPDRDADAVESRIGLLISNSNTINAATVMFKRECYTRLGGFSDELEFAFDSEYWMRIAVYYEAAFIAKPLAMWRVHSQTYTAMHIGTNRILRFKEDIIVKKIIADRHVKVLKDGRKIGRLIWQQMAERLGNDINKIGTQGKKKSYVLLYCVEMLLYYPYLSLFLSPYKAMSRILLGDYSVSKLKKLYEKIYVSW